MRDHKIKEDFGLMLKNKFSVLQDRSEEEEDSVSNRWQKVRETLRSACQEVLGIKKYQQKEWITAETLTKIEDRRRRRQ